jgi:hypothetical protein
VEELVAHIRPQLANVAISVWSRHPNRSPDASLFWAGFNTFPQTERATG